MNRGAAEVPLWCGRIRSLCRRGSGGKEPGEAACPQPRMANILTWTSWQAFACWAFVGPRHEPL